MNGQMPAGAPVWAQALPFAIPLVVFVFLMSRRLRPRPLNVKLLWISPAIITLGLGALLSYQPPPTDPLALLVLVVLLAAGALIGWYRGRLTKITVDPATHVVSAQVSPFGMVLLLVIFAIRQYGRTFLTQHAPDWHINPAMITDGSLLLAWGLIAVQRGEMWWRSRKLVEEARTAPAAPLPQTIPAEPIQASTPANAPIVQ